MNDTDEMRIGKTIAAAFDRLPEPDTTRLEKLGERLAYQAQRAPRAQPPRWRYWWLIGALVAGGAAAWWAGEFFIGDASKDELASPPAVTEEQGSTLPNSKTGRTVEKPLDTNSASDSKNPRIIYRRESR